MVICIKGKTLSNMFPGKLFKDKDLLKTFNFRLKKKNEKHSKAEILENSLSTSIANFSTASICNDSIYEPAVNSSADKQHDAIIILSDQLYEYSIQDTVASASTLPSSSLAHEEIMNDNCPIYDWPAEDTYHQDSDNLSSTVESLFTTTNPNSLPSPGNLIKSDKLAARMIHNKTYTLIPRFAPDQHPQICYCKMCTCDNMQEYQQSFITSSECCLQDADEGLCSRWSVTSDSGSPRSHQIQSHSSSQSSSSHTSWLHNMRRDTTETQQPVPMNSPVTSPDSSLPSTTTPGASSESPAQFSSEFDSQEKKNYELITTRSRKFSIKRRCFPRTGRRKLSNHLLRYCATRFTQDILDTAF